MDTLSYVFIAFLLFIIARTILADRTPIPETSGMVTKIASAAEFDALLAASAHVVVDFYADWCPPCRAIAPAFSALADQHARSGHLAFAKVNVDHVRDVAGRYGVSAMPTFLFFRGGAPAGVAVEGLPARRSVKVDGEGRVERVLGADKGALEAVVRSLAGK